MKSARFFIPFLLGIGLVAALFSTQALDLTNLFTRPLRMLGAMGVLCLSFVYIFLGAIKWRDISAQWKHKTEALSFYVSHTAQMMLISQFLPLPLATTLQRASVLKINHDLPVRKGVVHALYDLGFDFAIALIWVPASLAQIYYGWSFLTFALVGAACWVLCLGLLCVGPQLGARFSERIRNWSAQGLLAPSFLARLYLVSSLRFAVVILRLCIGAWALGFTVPWDLVALATPLSTMPSLLPLTPANLGIAEWSWAYLLNIWGIELAEGALYAAEFRILTFICHVLLALPFLLVWKKPKV